MLICNVILCHLPVLILDLSQAHDYQPFFFFVQAQFIRAPKFHQAHLAILRALALSNNPLPTKNKISAQ